MLERSPAEIVTNLSTLVDARRRFGVIYADPPSRYQTWSDRGRGRCADRHYATMTREQIRALPVEQLAAKDCALFCWFVDCHLLEALAAIETWGFSFKTIVFTWAKQTKDGSKIATSQGHWSRRNTEKVLFAVRGRPTQLDAGVPELVLAPRGRHSAKPEEVRRRNRKAG